MICENTPLREPEIVESFQFKFQKEVRELRHSKRVKIICYPRNSQYIGFLFGKNFYLKVKDSGQTLLHIFVHKARFTKCCISNDLKFAIVYFCSEKKNFTLMYDLQKKKRQWVKSFNSSVQDVEVNFYLDAIFFENQKYILKISFDGRILCSINVVSFLGLNQKQFEFISQIKVKNYFMLLLYQYFADSYFTKVKLCQVNNLINTKLISIIKPAQHIIGLTEYLFILMPKYFLKRILELREIFQGKLIRKFNHPGYNYDFKKFFLNGKMYLFSGTEYYELNLTSGKKTVYNCNEYIANKGTPIAQINEPFFFKVQQSQVWKKNLEYNRGIIKFFKFKI